MEGMEWYRYACCEFVVGDCHGESGDFLACGVGVGDFRSSFDA